MVANFTFLAQGADEPLKYKEGVSGIYINGIVKNNVSQNLIESTNLETIQDGALTPKIQHHSVFMDSAGVLVRLKLIQMLVVYLLLN